MVAVWQHQKRCVWDDGTITVVANGIGVYTMTGIDDAEPVPTLEGRVFANFSVVLQ